MTESSTLIPHVIENLSGYQELFDWQPIDKFALTRSLAWKGHVWIGSSEFIDKAGSARPWSAKTMIKLQSLTGQQCLTNINREP